MKLLPFAATAALALSAAIPAAAATFTNASFETGDTGGWTSTGGGSVAVVNSAVDFWQTPPLGETFDPTDGQFLAQLTAGDDAGTYTTLSQAFSLSGAATVSFDAAFLAFDSLPYDDDGYVRIFSQATNTVLFQASVSSLGVDFGHTEWTHVSQALGAGDYTIEAGVRNGLDLGGNSELLFDNVQVTSGAVPEPGSWGLMILGFAGLGGALRSRRTSARTA
jgi:hypothetical protein